MKRETHTIDAAGRRPGRLASEITKFLQGKNKPDYKPHIDGGDVVVVKNAGKMTFSGKKMDQKTYFRHSGYLGHEKHLPVREIFEKNPGKVLKSAVWNMLPKNKLRKKRIKRLKVQK